MWDINIVYVLKEEMKFIVIRSVCRIMILPVP